MLTSLCILFSTDAFYPKSDTGESTRKMTVSLASFFISIFASSFGITKFFVKGPLPILPKNAPLGGVLSMKFIILFLLNTMFVVRTFCLEAAFFTSYRSDNPLRQIDPLIPDEFRLIIYFLPSVCSFLINLLWLVFSTRKQDRKYLSNYPQFLLCPMFCPIMFEGNQDQRDSNKQPLRVWKLGSALNSVFLGCFPQTLLLVSDYYRRVSIWLCYDSIKYNVDSNRNDTDAFLPYQYGNTIFSITTLLSYSCLIIIFFFWDKIFKDNGYLCKPYKTVGNVFPKPCSSSMSDELGPTCINNSENAQQEREASKKNTQTVDSIETIDEEICIKVRIIFHFLRKALLNVTRKHEREFQSLYHFNIPFLFLKCYQKDVESVNHSDEYDRKNKEDHRITRTEWLKNILRKNRIIVLVATIVSFITCIGLILGIHYGSYGGINIQIMFLSTHKKLI